MIEFQFFIECLNADFLGCLINHQSPTLASFAPSFSFPLQFRKRVCVLLEKEKSRMQAHRDL